MSGLVSFLMRKNRLSYQAALKLATKIAAGKKARTAAKKVKLSRAQMTLDLVNNAREPAERFVEPDPNLPARPESLT